MFQKVCSNPDCKITYTVAHESDDGFCSFECWEKVNCHEPQNEVFEKIELPLV